MCLCLSPPFLIFINNVMFSSVIAPADGLHVPALAHQPSDVAHDRSHIGGPDTAGSPFKAASMRRDSSGKCVFLHPPECRGRCLYRHSKSGPVKLLHVQIHFYDHSFPLRCKAPKGNETVLTYAAQHDIICLRIVTSRRWIAGLPSACYQCAGVVAKALAYSLTEAE